MFGLKKQLIKSFIKLNVIENKPNFLKIHINKLQDIAPEYRVYEKQIIEAIKLLKGIENVQVDFNNSVVSISYDGEKVKPQTIFYWLQAILDVGLDNFELIEQYVEKDMDKVKTYLWPILESKVQQYNRYKG
ncbi:hypothetical protein CS063_16660 [Sporanaerobium hydrogeniformans]|uniref:Uncharacterized protein n=1 Tax=Sporanaerobium hydrogeniformans TaxID=3072179 RepID=A0AC61D6E4_9FIRM|nr:heavy-metal-associated domain-containing protein [Sporanaerobium hydrogeniformans]PHV69286.1 hypothetical protein CS063_16660 [Sporanaerobium hydrogeniformans]